MKPLTGNDQEGYEFAIVGGGGGGGGGGGEERRGTNFTRIWSCGTNVSY